MTLRKRRKCETFSFALAVIVLLAACLPIGGCSKDNSGTSPQPTATRRASVTPAAPSPTPASAAAASAQPGPAPGAASAQELQQLVSPIALYPDLLVAQILAGSTYPVQVVEADRWLKVNPHLSGDQLAAGVNVQPWDPSIKSLKQFPSVLQTMNDNLGWTSALGEAYYNQPADVMNAIQALRNMALSAGTLKNTPQQTLEVQPATGIGENGGQPVQQTVIIQPSQPNTVYVPQYNPTTVYGAPVQAPPGYSGSDLLLTGLVSFGAGMLIGLLINDGHNNWGCNWGGGNNHSVVYNNNVYVTKNNVWPARYPNGGYPRPGNPPRPMPNPGGRPPYNGGIPATRPYDAARARPYAGNENLPNLNFPKPRRFRAIRRRQVTEPGRGNANGPRSQLVQPRPTLPLQLVQPRPGQAIADGQMILRAATPEIRIAGVAAMVLWVDLNQADRRRQPAGAGARA